MFTYEVTQCCIIIFIIVIITLVSGPLIKLTPLLNDNNNIVRQ